MKTHKYPNSYLSLLTAGLVCAGAGQVHGAGGQSATAAYLTVQPNATNSGYLFTMSWVAPDHDNTGTDDYNETIYRNSVPGNGGSELDDVTNITGGRYGFDNSANGGGTNTEVRYRWGTNTGTVPANDLSAVGWQGTMDYTVDGTTAAPTRVTAIWDNLGAIQVGGSFQAYASGVQGVSGYYTASSDGSGTQKAAGVIHDDGDGGRLGFMVENTADAYETYTGGGTAPGAHYYDTGNAFASYVGAPTTGFIQVDIPYPTNGVVSDPFTERFNTGVYTNNSVVELTITTDNTYTPKIAVAGDFDSDGDVDNGDSATIIGGFTGPTGALGSTGSRYKDGNLDADSDVDNADVTVFIGNFTGSTAGNLTDSGTIADLVYNPATGELALDATEAAGGIITSFQLESAGQFLDGNYISLAVGSFGGAFENTSDSVLGDSDFSFTGASGLTSIGNVLTTGLDQASLEALLTNAIYSGSVGSGAQTFDLVVIPEPSAIGLLGLSAAGLFLRRRRK